MGNLVVAVLILLILSASVYAYYREKKKGKKCVGCPIVDSCKQDCG